MIYNRIEDIIGDTPLLRLNAADYGVQHVDIYVKLEYLNPFGSIKDRTAKYLVQNIDFAELRHNKAKLIESSSGNTAKALQMIAIARVLGLPR